MRISVAGKVSCCGKARNAKRTSTKLCLPVESLLVVFVAFTFAYIHGKGFERRVLSCSSLKLIENSGYNFAYRNIMRFVAFTKHK